MDVNSYEEESVQGFPVQPQDHCGFVVVVVVVVRCEDMLCVPARPLGDRPPRGRGGGRGGRGGRGRGMGRGDGFDSRGKRDFDRHSGNDKS